MNKSHISPMDTIESITSSNTLENRINVFKNKVLGWQLEIAEKLTSGYSQ